MFEFKITLDDEDYLLFNQYHLLNSPSGKKSLMSFRFITPFLCFMVIVIFCIAGSDFELILSEAIVMTIISILWIGYSKKEILKSMNKRIIKMKKEGRLPYSNEAILKFDDEKINEIAPNTENITKYSLIEKIVVTEKAIYIYFSSVQAYILPVTAFSAEMEKLKFLEFINMKVDILRDTKSKLRS
ncbi:YcxB family protein [Anaerocolumna sp. AGMB13025]|uniref:YcxB family protein n=1 Tax=Anaerocolumna sp. AGMB13025 TaxID=3039116 RepID=UPI00241F1B4D|nr:YcxB family protein [Anaerocolumna sp. AGMB13025]WFR59307.1 YcxB family protein [Anaerocolumna sp. AGMB13025]